MRQLTVALVALVTVLAASTAGVAGALGADTPATTAQHEADAETASVTFSNQTSGGTTVVVDEVTLPEGGFVTIHDASLAKGDALGSVVGTSRYLSPGTHENVTIRLEEPLDSSGTYIAMPHRDTDGDRIYEFIASNGKTDGPYTADGGAVTDSAEVTVSASVTMSDQPTDGTTVVVDRVELSEPGFVTIHDASLTEGAVFDSIRGTSQYLEAGVHTNVRIELDAPVSENTTLIPMAHRDTNGNAEYDFVETEGEEDGPFRTGDNSAVIDTASVTLRDTAMVSFDRKSTGGNTVLVESVFLPEGGFVTIHDGSLTEGKTFDSIRGTSQYLEPGLHRNVKVRLDDPLSEDATLVPMAHKDTDGDRQYDFVTSEGGEDGPYTADGSAVIDKANVTVSASVEIDHQSSDGRTVVVESVDLAEGGFVTIHDASLFAGEPLGSVVGVSRYLPAGHHENVKIRLDERLTTSQTLVAMPHKDTDGDKSYDFVTSEGSDDGPYVFDGGAVVDVADVTVPASLEFGSKTVEDGTVVVDSVTLRDGGFVTLHDKSLLKGMPFESVVATSAYLPPGTHTNVTIEVGGDFSGEVTMIAMPHRDTDGDETYDFVSSEGADDGPYVANGSAVVDVANLQFPADEGDGEDEGDEEMTTTTTTTTMDDETTTSMEDDGTTTGMETTSMAGDTTTGTTGDGGGGGTPGFGLGIAIVALLALAVLGARRSKQ